MTHYPFWPITVALTLVIAAVVLGRLKLKAQPLRLSLADTASAVLGSPDVSDNGRKLVRMYLDSAFSFRGHLLLAHFVMPFLAVAHAYRILTSDGKNPRERKEKNPLVQEAMVELTGMHLRITLANHPILCTSVLISMTAWFALAYLVIAIIGGIIPARVRPEEIAERVDYAYALIPIRLRGTSGSAHGCA